MNPKSRNVRLTLLCAAVSVGVVAAVAGCQTYDFEPVDPLAVVQRTKTSTITAHLQKPDLYLLVDRSGSMNLPTDPTDPDCTFADGGTCGTQSDNLCDTSVCPTRWSDMKDAMHSFLSNSGDVARMGLSFFPLSGSSDLCAAANEVAVPLNTSNDDVASMKQTATDIDTALFAETAVGGTPSGGSLAFVESTYAAVDSSSDRPKFILLLTDGLPNCNYALDNTTCTCTEPDCTVTGDGRLCLDQDGTVDQISQLAAPGKDIKTIVVGFGADTASGLGPAVLTAMANAGGFARTCPDGTDAECGTGDTCNVSTHTCNKPFYQAANGAELAAALAKISDAIVTPDPCTFTLDQTPSDPSLLSVLIDGVETPSGPDTWVYDTAPAIQFQGALCEELKNTTPSNPIDVQVQVVSSL
jgi:hypothetical protein